MQLAQAVHAAGESSTGNIAAGTYAVALSVASERELREVAKRLTAEGVSFVPIHEPDAPYRGAMMAIGVTPGPKREVGRFLSQLPLAR